MIDYKTYVDKVEMTSKKEIDKFLYTSFYVSICNNNQGFTVNEIDNILKQAGFHISNLSRLKMQVKKMKSFKNINKDTYVLTSACLTKMKEENTFLSDNSVIQNNGTLLNKDIFSGYTGYLDKLFFQANHCYENNCYDACATMLRRILEILLIKSYENLKIEDEIKDNNGNYFMLEKICNNAKNNKTLNLSRLRNNLDSFRDLGNFAAHRILYNTTKSDIDDKKDKLRALLEELLYKAGLKK